MSGGCGWTAPLYRSMFPSVLKQILECAPVKSEPVRLFDGVLHEFTRARVFLACRFINRIPDWQLTLRS